MRTISLMIALSFVTFAFAGFGAAADDECVPTGADESTYLFVEGYYVEDRDGLGVPGTGLVGGGTWVYEESNGIPGLQRGGEGPLGDDEFLDETCGAGPDTLIF